MKTLKTLGTACLVSAALVATTAAYAKERTTGRGNVNAPIVYVIGQGVYYDSIVAADPLPMKGNFQQLIPSLDGHGLATEFGPGDIGYLGGRWWLDMNGDGEMDEDDAFFLCPLLGPGRENPHPE
jgi:hypothetical protein